MDGKLGAFNELVIEENVYQHNFKTLTERSGSPLIKRPEIGSPLSQSLGNRDVATSTLNQT